LLVVRPAVPPERPGVAVGALSVRPAPAEQCFADSRQVPDSWLEGSVGAHDPRNGKRRLRVALEDVQERADATLVIDDVRVADEDRLPAGCLDPLVVGTREAAVDVVDDDLDRWKLGPHLLDAAVRRSVVDHIRVPVAWWWVLGERAETRPQVLAGVPVH